MPITPEEVADIIQGINDGKSLSEIESLSPLADKVHIHTNDTLEKFKSNLIETELEPAIKPRVRKVYENIDADLDKMGFEKIDGEEKTFDRIKRLGGEYTSMKTKHEEEMSELRRKLEAGEGSQALLDDFQKKEQEWNAKKSELEQQIGSQQKEMVDYRKGTIVSGILSKYRSQIKEGLPETMVNTQLDLITQEVVKSTKLSDDGLSLVVLNPDGSVKKNSGNYEPVTLDAELKSRLGDMLDPGRKAAGAGGQGGDPDPNPNPDPDKIEVDKLEIPEEIKTQVQLDEYLQNTLKLEGEKFFEASKVHGRDKNLPIQ